MLGRADALPLSGASRTRRRCNNDNYDDDNNNAARGMGKATPPPLHRLICHNPTWVSPSRIDDAATIAIATCPPVASDDDGVVDVDD